MENPWSVKNLTTKEGFNSFLISTQSVQAQIFLYTLKKSGIISRFSNDFSHFGIIGIRKGI